MSIANLSIQMVALEAPFLVEKRMCVIVHITSAHKEIPFSTVSSLKMFTGERVLEKPVDRARGVFSPCLTCVAGS